MRFFIIMALFIGYSTVSFSEEFDQVCAQKNEDKRDLSLFSCGQTSIPKSIKKLIELNEAIGVKQCRQYSMELKRDRKKSGLENAEKQFLIFDRKRKTSRPLKCFCQDKMGKGLCGDSEKFDSKLAKFNEPFQVNAWVVFTKDLFEQSVRGGSSCIQKIKESLDKDSCSQRIDEIHQKSISKLNLVGIDGELLLKSKNLSSVFSSLEGIAAQKDEHVFEPVSSYYKTEDFKSFVDNFGNGKSEKFLGLSTSEYESRLKELNLFYSIEKFSKVLRQENPERSLRENFKDGINFFQLDQTSKGEELAERITLASHPDLKWLFSGIESFNGADKRRQLEKFLKFSTIAKENPFATLKELRLKYEEKHGPECESLIRKVTQICKMDGSQNLALAKEVSKGGRMKEILGFSAKDVTDDEVREMEKVVEEVECFQFPDGYVGKSSELTELVERSIDKKVMLDKGVEISKIEARVDLAINKVQGLENIAERIQKAKIEGNDPEKVEKLEDSFGEYLSKLELPNGRGFSYPSGAEPAQAVTSYKSQVYEWADEAVEKRITDIQGETQRIVNSNLTPEEKKRKLSRLLDEVQRLNSGNFLEKIHKEKRKIGEYIAQYEDKKRDWEAQYAEEAKINPKAVMPVAPPRKESFSRGNGINSFQQTGPTGGSFSSLPGVGKASTVDEAEAYIPPRPSLPFAQGSMLTRIVPKNEFKDSTVKASLLARHKGYPIAVLDEKALTVELYTPDDGNSYKLQETLSIDEAEARGYVFPDDIKKLVAGYKKDKKLGRAPASFDEYSPKQKDLLEKKKNMEKLQSLADAMERQGIPRRSRVMHLNSILDSI